jgi:hypothetical protein
MVDGRFDGLASQRIRPQNGSQIRSRKPAAGNKLPAISLVTRTGPMVRCPSEGFDQWAFATDQPSPRSPWQNGYAERLIGSIRRECLDHVVVFGERHLRHLLLSYMKYYNGPARIYPWRRMHRSRAPSIAPGTFFAVRFWVAYTTSMFGFDLRQAQVHKILSSDGTILG